MADDRPKECPQDGAASIPAPVPVPTVGTSADTTQRDRDDKLYDEYRKSLIDLEHDQAKEYDKWVLTLTGIALGFSLTLVKDFIKPNNAMPRGLLWLYGAWILFALPIALITFNLQVSYSAAKEYRRIVDTLYLQYDSTANFWEEVRQQMRCVRRKKWVEWFNWVSLFSFLAGIVCLVIFVGCNVK